MEFTLDSKSNGSKIHAVLIELNDYEAEQMESSHNLNRNIALGTFIPGIFMMIVSVLFIGLVYPVALSY